jgi:hypothetical protein
MGCGNTADWCETGHVPWQKPNLPIAAAVSVALRLFHPSPREGGPPPPRTHRAFVALFAPAVHGRETTKRCGPNECRR